MTGFYTCPFRKLHARVYAARISPDKVFGMDSRRTERYDRGSRCCSTSCAGPSFESNNGEVAAINAPTEATLTERLRAYLTEVAARGVPVTYNEAARAIGLEPPFTIHRITEAIEHLMAEDAAAGRPFIAALVISKARHGLPAVGFFDCATRLRRFDGDSAGPEARAFHGQEFNAAVAFFGKQC